MAFMAIIKGLGLLFYILYRLVYLFFFPAAAVVGGGEGDCLQAPSRLRELSLQISTPSGCATASQKKRGASQGP